MVKSEGGIRYDRYINAAIITLIVVAIGLLAIRFIDENRKSSVEAKVDAMTTEMDKTKLLFLYMSAMNESDRPAVCDLLDYSMKNQMDSGSMIVGQLKDYEKANLLSDYKRTREKYFLSNFELWFYTTREKEICSRTDMTTILFFHEAESMCPECTVQGGVLDEIRAKCSNVRVITFARDLDIGMVDILKKRFKVRRSPTLVIDNSIVLEGLQDEKTILSSLNCTANSG